MNILKNCKNVLWCLCFLEGAEQFHSCFLEMAEQFHSCFLEGAEQFHFCMDTILILQIGNFGYATELLMLKLLYTYRVYTFKWPKKENFGYFSLN